MQRDIVIKGRSLGGASDLTLLAPIKPGFVDSLESVTHKTRIKRVLELLHGARVTAYEYHDARLLSDSIERVGAIHSVRVAVLEPENKVLLAVTFDGSWQSYIRVLWDKVGTLLDLIFHDTDGYVLSYGNTFEAWLAWAYAVQVETGFFYGPADATARDVLYHRRTERLRLRGPRVGSMAGGGVSAELLEMRTVLPTAEDAVGRIVDSGASLLPDDPQIVPVVPPRMVAQRMRNGLRGLSALYRLTDLYRPTTDDGEVLRRASIDLLREFVLMHDGGLATDPFKVASARFDRQLHWLFDAHVANAHRPVPPPAADDPRIDDATLAKMQGGIVRQYRNVTHGAIVMVAFADAVAASDFLAWSKTHVARGHEEPARVDAEAYGNVAFTVAGLRAAGLSEDEVMLFPEEYRQGMAARAGLLGDVRNNHPRRWRLPLRHGSTASARPDGRVEPGYDAIDLETVHAVVQWAVRATEATRDVVDVGDEGHPLNDVLAAFERANPRITVLAVQSLRRNFRDAPGMAANTTTAPSVVEHFGFVDGISQPEVEPAVPRNTLNRTKLGEIVLGYDDAADFAKDMSAERAAWMRDGSFLVMRKYRQYVHRLESVVAAAVADMQEQTGATTDYTELVYAKLMGRSRDGTPLVPHADQNRFLFSADPQGIACPLHAHIRLANPRQPNVGGSRKPRLMRRGMSYGPPHAAGVDDDADDRGLVFMAYGASIAEQFEVIQRWLSGGNSTASSSGQGCPFVGVPENGLTRHHRFEGGVDQATPQVFRAQLEAKAALFEDPEVFAQLEWGLYLFTPSIAVLDRLHARAVAAIGPRTQVPWKAEDGEKRIRQLAKIRGAVAAREAWKAALEDPEAIDRLEAAAIWAAIRDNHGGVLHTPYGTLVADRGIIQRVLSDPSPRYSVKGQRSRMKACFGDVYLGMDNDARYVAESTPVNAAIMALTDTPQEKARVFELARDAAHDKLGRIVADAIEQGAKVGESRFEVSFDLREVIDDVLADLGEAWFGLADAAGGTPLFSRGSADWLWTEGEPPPYPGHYTAMSRYTFQPDPGDGPKALGKRYGRSLIRAMRVLVKRHRRRGSVPMTGPGLTREAPIAKAIFDHVANAADPDFAARTMVGILMGLNPTISGATLNIVREWQRDDRFGALRTALAGADSHADALTIVEPALLDAARMRPMPPSNWRTATDAHAIVATDGEPVPVAKNGKVVLATVSATQQSIEDGQPDGRLMFGGDRTVAGHPLHACPGYGAGMSAILGILTALLARREMIRQGVGPLAFVIEGVIPPSPAQSAIAPRSVAPPTDRKGLILAWGDSWLDYSFAGIPVGKDLRDWLAQFGYAIPADFCKWTTWTKVETMAADPKSFREFVTLQIENTPPEHPLLAVLLSGGGNDSTGDALEALINEKGTSQFVIDPAKLKTHMDKLEARYTRIVRALLPVLAIGSGSRSIPILVHGYDHPLPRGAGYAGWLRVPFENRKYDVEDPDDLEAATGGMRDIVDAFNARLHTLEQDFPGQVRHVNLTGIIAGHFHPTESGWANDLHPVNEAFGLCAVAIDAVLETLPR